MITVLSMNLNHGIRLLPCFDPIMHAYVGFSCTVLTIIKRVIGFKKFPAFPGSGNTRQQCKSYKEQKEYI